MKLSKIVHQRNLLQRHNVEQIHYDASTELAKVLHTVQSSEVQLDFAGDNLAHDFTKVAESFDQFNNTLQKLIADLDEQIESQGKAYFAESYRMYEQEMIYESVDWILNRRVPMSEETKKMIVTRIQSYSDWRYAGMVIRPGLEDFIKHLVSFDPLYIIDREHDLLVPAMQTFPPEYQRRLRPYSVKENINQPILDKIPDNQFGLCLAFNFFEFKPFEILKKYLEEIYQKLKPGGMLLMTYNDCDRAHCVSLVEAHFTCYTPGGMVRALAKTIGYEEVFHWTEGGNLTWVEFKKKGELTSLRGGQTLAKVIPK